MMKYCKSCGKYKPTTDFYKKTSSKDGFNYLCKACDSKKRSDLRFKNIVETLKRERLSSRKYKDKNPFRFRALTTYNDHKRSGKIMNITVNDIEKLLETSDICPLCGTKYNKQYGHGRTNNSQSLDRIDNSIIINNENVWIICYKCNIAKGNMTVEEFISYCKQISLHNGGK